MSALGHVGGPSAPVVSGEEAQKRGWTGYLLMLPGTFWLVMFFVVPTVSLVASSLYDPSGSLLEGYHGINDVCLSVPTIVSASGVGERLQVPLSTDELGGLRRSADAVREVARRFGY